MAIAYEMNAIAHEMNDNSLWDEWQQLMRSMATAYEINGNSLWDEWQ